MLSGVVSPALLLCLPEGSAISRVTGTDSEITQQTLQVYRCEHSVHGKFLNLNFYQKMKRLVSSGVRDIFSEYINWDMVCRCMSIWSKIILYFSKNLNCLHVIVHNVDQRFFIFTFKKKTTLNALKRYVSGLKVLPNL